MWYHHRIKLATDSLRHHFVQNSIFLLNVAFFFFQQKYFRILSSLYYIVYLLFLLSNIPLYITSSKIRVKKAPILSNLNQRSFIHFTFVRLLNLYPQILCHLASKVSIIIKITPLALDFYVSTTPWNKYFIFQRDIWGILQWMHLLRY